EDQTGGRPGNFSSSAIRHLLAGEARIFGRDPAVAGLRRPRSRSWQPWQHPRTPQRGVPTFCLVDVAVAFVLRRHLQKITEPRLENFCVVARHIEPADADALIPFREAIKVLPDFRVAL